MGVKGIMREKVLVRKMGTKPQILVTFTGQTVQESAKESKKEK